MGECKDKLKQMYGEGGEGWFYVNDGSVEFYTTHIRGRAPSFTFKITRRQLESILRRMRPIRKKTKKR